MKLPQVSFRVMLLLWACWGVLIPLLFLPSFRHFERTADSQPHDFGKYKTLGWGPFRYLTKPLSYIPPHPEDYWEFHHPGLELVLIIGSGATMIAVVSTFCWLRSAPVRSGIFAKLLNGFFALALVIELFLSLSQFLAYDVAPTFCHPGCFPAGSLIMTPTGSAPVESLRVGDRISTVELSGATTVEEVEVVFSTCTALLWVDTVDGSLATTPVQPLVLEGGQLRAAGELQPGDMVLRCQEGKIVPTKVLGTRQSNDHRQVYNLVIKGQEPRPFVANGFLARSKPPAIR